jgi:hypothetical protein
LKKSIFPVEKTILSKNLEKPVIKPEKPACQVYAKKNWVFANPDTTTQTNLYFVTYWSDSSQTSLILKAAMNTIAALQNKNTFEIELESRHCFKTSRSKSIHFRLFLYFGYVVFSLFCLVHRLMAGVLLNRYKDGIPYPWLGGGLSFILDPGTLNQTIYSGAVRESDAGQYKCVVRNDTHNVSHTISLTVLGELLLFAPTFPICEDAGKVIRFFIRYCFISYNFFFHW